MLSSLKGLVSNTLDHLDELTTIDEKKWIDRAKKGMDNIKGGVDSLILEPVTLKPRPLDLYAGADLVRKYDGEWTRIYRQHLDMIHNSKVLDLRVRRVAKACEDQLAILDRFHTHVSLLPQISEAALRASALIGELGQRCEAVENLFDQFDKDSEAYDMERFVRHETALYDEHIVKQNRELRAREFLVRKAKDDAIKAEQMRIHAEEQQAILDKEEAVRLTREKIRAQLSAIAIVDEERRPRSASTRSQHDVDAEVLAKVALDVPVEEQDELDAFLTDAPAAAAPQEEIPAASESTTVVVNTANEMPEEATQEPPVEPTETKTETVETPAETKEASEEAKTDAPVEATTDAPAEATTDAPAEAQSDAPAEAKTDAPAEADAPAEVTEEAAAPAPVEEEAPQTQAGGNQPSGKGKGQQRGGGGNRGRGGKRK